MPVEAMRRAEAASRDCDLFIVLGSSLVVYPAAALPQVAKSNGAALAIINREPTDMDGRADVVIHAEIGAVLREIAP
jgi:NAD-dependent deacetylase